MVLRKTALTVNSPFYKGYICKAPFRLYLSLVSPVEMQVDRRVLQRNVHIRLFLLLVCNQYIYTFHILLYIYNLEYCCASV